VPCYPERPDPELVEGEGSRGPRRAIFARWGEESKDLRLVFLRKEWDTDKIPVYTISENALKLAYKDWF